ncbi:SDR family oxidoreductase [Xanthomonas vasicola]|uniref:NAD-dependent epimerase/dehydratase family protein n=1 Tax=Xanthomonas vasicola TaxID=56459 RepID=A0ABD7SGS5_XANVA|nr:SDR family oxidoreductase [Xanthomonas vasicola]AZR24426.1 NAD-dependent epimerase/dehydratase family protein [Xanthomonas vasicola]KGR38575.1 membrane protein [Xanthomonas vasicola]KGR39077.1 membrane protein [Xanthomonas vasicola]KGR59370.1 membrane protein [Xanthomonas vasicola]MDO6984961.1 SDR family oxidoreductase [Xanthomonas vasicola]
MRQTASALVLGASGGIGGEVARQLRDAGWQVRALQRGFAANAEHRDGIDWRRGDAMQQQDVLQAARGCAVIVHAVNPPGYRRWSELVLPMLDNSIAAARAEGATIVLPGTVYNYGPDAYPSPDEDAPQTPTSRKGAIRVEMERRLQAATADGARALIVRAGDYFGPRARNSWFAQGLVTPGRPVTTVTLPGAQGVGHQWAYLPDVAQCVLRLLQRRDTLPAFARLHMAGHWDADGTQMAAAIGRVVVRHGGAQPKLRRFPWWAIPLASPFVPLARELREIRPLWSNPLRLRNTRLLEVLGEEPHTPLDAAVEATLSGLGCLPTPLLAPAH